MGESRKYPYPTTGGMNILTPLAFGNSKMFYPSPMPSEFQNRYPLLPSEISDFFSDPLEFLFDRLKLPLNGKLVLFPPLRKFCSQLTVKQTRNSSLLMFNTVHRSFPF